jgi:hypothetical protein
MLTLILISILYLFSITGFTLLRYNKAGIGEKPLAYKSTIIGGVLILNALIWIAFTIFLIFYNWKLLLFLIFLGVLLGRLIIEPIIEFLLSLIYSKIKNLDRE